ncbi:MAG: hypothetical protein JSR78_11055 [Proteobacteria bacterium]|nr:hypothetical protein [Pseudomonadota bacterium]
MKVVRRVATDSDIETILLKRAIRVACTELIEVQHVSNARLPSLFAVIAETILKHYKEGNCDATVLGQQAAMKALGHIGRRPH